MKKKLSKKFLLIIFTRNTKVPIPTKTTRIKRNKRALQKVKQDDFYTKYRISKTRKVDDYEKKIVV